MKISSWTEGTTGHCSPRAVRCATTIHQESAGKQHTVVRLESPAEGIILLLPFSCCLLEVSRRERSREGGMTRETGNTKQKQGERTNR